ncbi:MAG: hypothetical protein D6687_01200 [Acidobacteria bacterium]|jgi:hypothetical protein|nr:MAG: hypothetical protein D6687_01200 [Acidobacteriota bacterium]GIU82014.1 MAG: hypothetical protein KatS3mg006_1078 [Pyrinomonadaceae bacterium]
MEEFEASWLSSLQTAREKALKQGNVALVEYLDLKIRNDRIRFEAGKILFESFVSAIQEKIADGYKLEIETKSPHQFQMYQAVLTGHLLTVNFGIRKLTIEFGWTRKPEDGFMRKNALAYARITHLGKPQNNAELFLLFSQNQNAEWFSLERNGNLRSFRDCREHIEALIR